jgi:hypothetical protein
MHGVTRRFSGDMRVVLVLLVFTVPLADACAQGVIDFGEAVLGDLSSSDSMLPDGSYFDEWRFHGTAGTTLQVALASDAFDTFLNIGRDDSGAFNELKSNDDGPSGTDSELTYTLPNDGVYVVRANSLSDGKTGSYRLTLTTDGNAVADPYRGALVQAVPVMGTLGTTRTGRSRAVAENKSPSNSLATSTLTSTCTARTALPGRRSVAMTTAATA